jgi:hypothetical protein
MACMRLLLAPATSSDRPNISGPFLLAPHNSDGPSDIDQWPVATMGAHGGARLLLAPTVAMGHLTSAAHYYSPTSSDGPSNIRGLLLLWGHMTRTQLLLAPTVVTGHLTLATHCYSPTSSNKPSDIRGLLLLWGHMARVRLLLVPTTATGRLTSAAHCYSPHSSDMPFDIKGLLLL